MQQGDYEKMKVGSAKAVPPERASGAPTVAPLMTGNVSPRGPPADDGDILLTATQMRALIGGVSTMCIWRWVRDPAVRFPPPLKIGTSNRNYWFLRDIRRWQAERVGRAA